METHYRAVCKEADLEREDLAWRCIEPALLAVKAKSAEVKANIYERLNAGQKALYLFYAFHNHAGTRAEFYWFTYYYLYVLPAWPGLKEGLAFFGDQPLLRLLEEAELLVEEHTRGADGARREASPSDLDADASLGEAADRLFSRYGALAGETIGRMNAYIRAHPAEFLRLE
ncbi:hypothetical protein GXP70_13315 [Paenibacillus lycopersici]|uniref:DUF4375 domain-containing protein n=1 Tax=Paenibacillus lycopersici TaxID=2704462 RepID=A0A6C0FZD1_9BACL|nr:hypothetical protein [Paenibacillus lycopersici]QHT60831.1 hypothetical protein GXP70_13315 [Paenibacillus lycopersici]